MLAFLAIALGAFAFLLYLGSGLTFFWDEWSWIINRQDWSIGTLMDAYNEHWSLVPLLIYKTLLSGVGLGSYLPYLAVLLVLHVSVAGALFWLVRRCVGPLVALAVATLFLFFGAGYENLLWASGITYLSAVAPGAWALVLVLSGPPRWPRLVAALLLVCVAASGVGLFFLAATTVALLLPRDGRRHLWPVVPAFVAYGAWFLAIGHTALRTPITVATLQGLPLFLADGIGAAAESVFGLGKVAALVLLVGLAVAAIQALRESRPRVLVAAGSAGLLAQFVLIGVSRKADEFNLSRYQYVAAVFLLVAIAGILSGLRIGTGLRNLSGRWFGSGGWFGSGRWSGDRALIIPVAIVALISIANGLPILSAQRVLFLTRADDTRALISLQLRYGGSPALPENRVPGGPDRRSGLLVAGSPQVWREVVRTYGSPLADSLYGTRPISAAALDGVLFQLVKQAVLIGPAAGPPLAALPLQVDRAQNVAVSSAAESCLLLQPSGPGATLSLEAPGGSLAALTSPAGGSARLYLSRHGVFADPFLMNYDWMPGFVDVPLAAGVATAVAIPDIGDPARWQVRLDLPAGSATTLCLGASRPVQ